MSVARLVDLAAELPGGRQLSPLLRIAETLLGLTQLNALYARVGGQGLSAPDFCRAVLMELGVEFNFEGEGLLHLGKLRGPVLLVANHPLGGRDALLMHLLLGAARPDYRILANRPLGRVPETRARLILVDSFGGAGAAARNLGPLREAKRWLSQGGLLGVFPAGEVSHWQSRERQITDGPWAPQALRLAQAVGATIISVFFSGQSSAGLRALARVHPTLKTPWLVRELIFGPAKQLKVRVGEPISSHDLPAGSPQEQVDWLRQRTYELSNGFASSL